MIFLFISPPPHKSISLLLKICKEKWVCYFFLPLQTLMVELSPQKSDASPFLTLSIVKLSYCLYAVTILGISVCNLLHRLQYRRFKLNCNLTPLPNLIYLFFESRIVNSF